jgi:hypothetical protein
MLNHRRYCPPKLETSGIIWGVSSLLGLYTRHVQITARLTAQRHALWCWFINSVGGKDHYITQDRWYGRQVCMDQVECHAHMIYSAQIEELISTWLNDNQYLLQHDFCLQPRLARIQGSSKHPRECYTMNLESFTATRTGYQTQLIRANALNPFQVPAKQFAW